MKSLEKVKELGEVVAELLVLNLEIVRYWDLLSMYFFNIQMSNF